MTIKKSLATVGGTTGNLIGTGYVDMDKRGKRNFATDKVAFLCDQRFETINKLPKIASKYRKSDRGFSIEH